MGGSRKPVPPPATRRWGSIVFPLPALRPASRQCEQPGELAGESSAAPSSSTAPVQRWAAEPSSVTDGRTAEREGGEVGGWRRSWRGGAAFADCAEGEGDEALETASHFCRRRCRRGCAVRARALLADGRVD